LPAAKEAAGDFLCATHLGDDMLAGALVHSAERAVRELDRGQFDGRIVEVKDEKGILKKENTVNPLKLLILFLKGC